MSLQKTYVDIATHASTNTPIAFTTKESVQHKSTPIVIKRLIKNDLNFSISLMYVLLVYLFVYLYYSELREVNQYATHTKSVYLYAQISTVYNRLVIYMRNYRKTRLHHVVFS